MLPAFSSANAFLNDFEGQYHTLDEYTGNGKWLIVMLWASDCHICNQEIDEYIKFHQKHNNKNASVLGISLDGMANRQNALDFLTRHKVSFPSLIGNAELVASLYENVTGTPWVGTPSFLIFSPKGELLVKQVGAVPTHLIENFMTSHKTEVDN